MQNVEAIGCLPESPEADDSFLENPDENAEISHVHSRRPHHRLSNDEDVAPYQQESRDHDEWASYSDRCSMDDDTKSFLAHSKSPTEGKRHPLLSLLPSLSFLPPLLHRYTGTTTESLLVGVTCCVINTALYITSGVVTRVLQQQEHVMAPQAQQLDQTHPCLPEVGENAATACSALAPDVVVEHLRVPYLMVWLPQACQVVFLFIALAKIKKKYDFYIIRNRSDSSSEHTNGAAVGHHEGGTTDICSQEQTEQDVEALMPERRANTATGGLALEVYTDRQLSTDAKSASSILSVGEAVPYGTDSSEGALFGNRSLANEPGAPTVETNVRNCSCAASCIQNGECGSRLKSGWRALTEQYNSRIYEPHLKDYHICVQAFLKEEMKYESLGKLVLACLLVMCLYILQGWFWSIAVGATGMSVCSVTAIYSTNSLFVFLFTSLIYKEGTDDFIQMIALILATVGVALIAYESQGEPQSTTGVILSIFSSATYGLFEVLYKMYLLQNRSNHPITFVFFVSGLMGALSLVFLWVPVPVLHALNWESFPSSPPPFLALFLLTLSCVCSSLYTILLQMSLMLLPSPMLVAMCSLLSLPPAAASDALRGGGGGVGSSGCAFIAFSLIITGIKEWNIKERGDQQGPKLGDLCMPFFFGAEPRLSSDTTQGS